MVSFYPGPSKVYDQLPTYAREAFEHGILSVNHRSEEFMDLSRHTISLLKEKLSIPPDFSIFYLSSATECWEVIAESLIANKSVHYFNGAFGQKWHQYTDKITNSARASTFVIEEPLKPNATSNADVICITQNETSNGTSVSDNIIKEIKKNNPDSLIAVDATSSLGGIELEMNNADVWFASVQKCLGLPAGMAIMVCSPKAIARGIELNRKNHYNSLVFMIEKMKSYQTTYTPNVLGIYLLMRVLEARETIDRIDKQIRERFSNWIDFLNNAKGIKHLISNNEVHSLTVLPITASKEMVSSIKIKAKKSGYLMGNGYGLWSDTTFRIANFPALTLKEIDDLQTHLLEIIN